MEVDQEPRDPGLPHYKIIKTSLASILRLHSKHDTITKAVCTVDKIVTRSLMFLKLYLIHTTEHPPIVDKDFIDTIFKTVCKKTTQGRPPSASNKTLREALTAFYDEHFKSLLPHEDQDLAYTHLNTVLDYSSVQLATVFKNNIKMHYVEYVEAYVDCVWQKHDLISRIRRTRKTKREREAAIRKLTGNLRDIKTDLLNVGGEAFKSHPAYHSWIREQKAFVLPAKVRYQKDLLYYDLQCQPNDYYPAMLRMTEFVEQAGRRPRNFSPLRTSVIPKHICIDTTTLVHLLYDRARDGQEIRGSEKWWYQTQPGKDMGNSIQNRQTRASI